MPSDEKPLRLNIFGGPRVDDDRESTSDEDEASEDDDWDGLDGYRKDFMPVEEQSPPVTDTGDSDPGR